MLLSIVGRGGMGIRTTNDKKHIRHKTYISSWKHAHDQLMISGESRSNSATPSPLHCDLEHIHRIPTTKLCVCARASVCVIFILKVVFGKLSFIEYMGGIILKEALLFFLLFFVFLDYVKYKYYRQQQFLQQKNKKNKEEKKN